MKSKMKSFIILLLLLLCGKSGGLLREYIFISRSLSWSDAQTYCKQTFTDLATITTPDEQQRALESGISGYISAWVGLWRTESLSHTWQWSDGKTPTYFKWDLDPAINYTLGDCVALTVRGWTVMSCTRKLYFICYRSLTLVKENRTWKEALEYCRPYHTSLATLIVPSQLRAAELEAAAAQTVSVWTGLRFLDGKWMWVTGAEASSAFLPNICPQPGYYCGAHNFNTDVWENRVCSEKLQFLCY